MSWIYPGVAVLDGLRLWARSRLITQDERKEKEAAKARKRIREKLWDLRNPGKRRSYDRNLLARVKAWRSANKEKVRQMARNYARTEHGKMMIRAKTARYRARKRARLEGVCQ